MIILSGFVGQTTFILCYNIAIRRCVRPHFTRPSILHDQKMKTSKFNAFDYFEGDDEILDYLSDCFNDDDPQLFVTALLHLIEKKALHKLPN